MGIRFLEARNDDSIGKVVIDCVVRGRGREASAKDTCF